MKSGKMKRNFWLNSEIDCMLQIFGEIQIKQKHKINKHYAFVQIANSMKKRGFPNKTADQIKRKWFQMKSAYLCYKRGNVDRLLVIPEEFRSIIAQFVEFESKNMPIQNKDFTTNSVNEKPNTMRKVLSTPVLDGQQLHSSIGYSDIEKSLLREEMKYQRIRDKNWCNHFSSYLEHSKSIFLKIKSPVMEVD